MLMGGEGFAVATADLADSTPIDGLTRVVEDGVWAAPETKDAVGHEQPEEEETKESTMTKGEQEKKQEEEKDEEEQDGEEEGEEEDNLPPVTTPPPPPELEEGFYEIEDVRKKRIRRGELQYLIKWRGWPESANTWEPLENLQSCLDVIEAFEERLRSPKSSRKRKRKQGGPLAVANKKHPRQREGTYTASTIENSAPSEAHQAHIEDRADRRGEEEAPGADIGGELDENKELVERENNAHGDGNSIKEELKRTKGSEDAVKADEHKKEDSKTACGLVENGDPSHKEGGVGSHISIHLPGMLEGDASVNGLSNIVEHGQASNGIHLSGAKRRKSGSVRRIQQDSASSNPENAQNGAVHSGYGNTLCDKRDKSGNEDVDSTEDEMGDNKKLDETAKPPSIAKILKVVKFFTSVSNDVQKVSLTFKAQRVDGKKVLVSDQELKVTDPLLLIAFYEQHLRYGKS